MSVDTSKVLLSIQNFPRVSSPGWSQLRARHLFDTICGSTSSSAHDCLTELTHWLNLLLAGKAHLLLRPWLSGAQLTALKKKDSNSFRSIAVGGVFRRLASRLCCTSVFSRVSDLFLPYGQVGVGISWGPRNCHSPFTPSS